MRITLGELLDLFDYERTSGMLIQICDEVGDWDAYDELSIGSQLLYPLEQCKVLEVGAIEKDILRVNIDWSDAKWINT